MDKAPNPIRPRPTRMNHEVVVQRDATRVGVDCVVDAARSGFEVTALVDLRNAGVGIMG